MKKLLTSLLVLVLALALALPALAAIESATAEPAPVEDTNVIIGATPSPHAEILEVIKPLMEAKGFQMEIQVFTDYIVPNEATESGELDANYFQHKPYMDDFNTGRGTHLLAVIPMHFEPMAVYPGQTASFDAIQDGATIAVPNDVTNEARALLLLEAQGLIKIAEGKGLTATKLDIKENPHNIEFYEVDAAQVARSLPDVDFAVINGNYALEVGLFASTDGIAAEGLDSEAAQTYINYVVVKEGTENSAWLQAFREVLEEPAVKTFIDEKYQGAVIPAFVQEVPATDAPTDAPADVPAQ